MDMVSFFNKCAEHWDDEYTEKDNIRCAVASLCGAREDSKVLDIACGTGIMFSNLLDLNVNQIVGIDISDKMIENAQVKFKDESKVKVICGDVLNLKEKGFDVALVYNAYPHFLNKEALISHVAGLLNKGGRITIAHGSGKDAINKCHHNVPDNISSKLLDAKEEAKRFEKWFDIDIVADTPYFYMISGVVKK